MDPVVPPERLAEWLAGPMPPVVLDVRWTLGGRPGRVDYEAGHLPGASYLDVDTDLSGLPGPAGRHPLPDPEALQVTLRGVGVRTGGPVVAYDTADGTVAARLWWLLRWVGHTQVAILDGGFTAWCAAGLPMTTEVPQPQPGTITVRPGAMPVVDAAQAAELARHGSLLDARAAPRYRGEVEPVDPLAGHVPGARNTPATDLTDEHGRWLSPARLRERFGQCGITGQCGVTGQQESRTGGGIGAYCGSGVTACTLVLGLELAGVAPPERPAALYAGSWSNWCADPGRPVATGPHPGSVSDPPRGR